MKTLKQLWDEVGGPFWAVSDGGTICHISGYNPRETTLWHAWMIEDNKQEMRSIVLEDTKAWTLLIDDPTKEQEPLRVWARSDTKTLVVSETNPKIGADEWTDITAELARALLPELKRLEQE